MVEKKVSSSLRMFNDVWNLNAATVSNFLWKKKTIGFILKVIFLKLPQWHLQCSIIFSRNCIKFWWNKNKFWLNEKCVFRIKMNGQLYLQLLHWCICLALHFMEFMHRVNLNRGLKHKYQKRKFGAHRKLEHIQQLKLHLYVYFCIFFEPNPF